MEEEAPEYFYKYRSYSKHLLSQLAHDEVRFAPPVEFNDPFDCKPIFDLTATKSETIKKLQGTLKKFSTDMSRKERRESARNTAKNSQIQEYKQLVEDHYFHRIRNGIGVYCLSTTWKNILMWSHYADNHKGVCLEYDGLDLFFSDAFKVIYSENRPIVYGMKDADQEVQLNNALLTKSKLWEYEKEWRMIYYGKGPGIYKTPNNILRKVIFGAGATQETIDSVMEAINKRENKPEVCFAKLSASTFDVYI